MPGGRPPKYRKDFHPADFIRLSEVGKTFAQIAGTWKIDRDTIKDWRAKHSEFSAAVKIGRQLAEHWYMEIGQKAMLGHVTDKNGNKLRVDLGWFCWMTKNMFQWSDRHQVDQKTVVVDVDKETALVEWLKNVGKD